MLTRRMLLAIACLLCAALTSSFSSCNKQQAQPVDVSTLPGMSEEDQRKEMEEMGMPPDLIKSLTQKAIRKAAVTKGQALKWRTLWQTTNGQDSPFAMMDVANLDGDKDDEIYLHHTNQIIEINGKSRVLSFEDSIDAFWDYNGDGVDDAILSEFDLLAAEDKDAAKKDGATDHMVAYSLSGKKLGVLKGHQLGPQIIFADLDGDGRRDIFLSEEGDYGPDPAKGVRGFGKGGKEILSEGPELNSPYLIAGDIDGDGKDEVLGLTEKHGVQAIGVGQMMTPVEYYANPKVPFDGAWAHDFDGDGTTEVLSSKGSIHNLVTKQVIELELPTGYKRVHIDGMFGGNAVAFSDHGQPRIAALFGDTGTTDETLAIWDLTGKLVYAEDFGVKCEGLRVARDHQGDHIAVLNMRRLLIWP